MNYRHEIVHLYHEKNMTERHIARVLDVPPSTVHYWLTRPGKESNKKCGRPRVTDSTLDLDLGQASLTHPFMTARELQEELAPHCSVDTVRRRLKEQGQRCCIPARKPFLKPMHLQKRFAFASDHRDWSVDQWHEVVFSDEKIFRASSRGPLRVYRPARGSDRFDPRFIAPSDNPAGRHTVCVWMAFGGGGLRVLHRIEQRTLNAQYYTERILPLIEEELVENEFVFMQDLSSIHKSRLTTTWLSDHNVRVMDDWPPKGPDMNPVENVWAEIVRRTRHDSTNRNQLWENVLHTFNQLPDVYFTNLVESMPRRMRAVNAKSGGWTKY